MAGGSPFTHTIDVAMPPEQALQAVTGAVAGSPGCSINYAGPNSLVITRRYIPTWAIVGAVIGFFFILLGLLLLLVKETETLTVTAMPLEGGGSRLSFSGTASGDVIRRVTAFVGYAGGGQAPIPAGAVPAFSPAPGGSTCVNGHAMAPGANFCASCGAPAAAG